ncbi:hypothetical protein RUZ38_004363 [Vibrio vulnificus]|nr:hypothetical protein [Vibrio vulnificus]
MSTSEVCCISEFFEVMDHEFPEIETSLELQGYKVDGNNGIKKHCKFNDLKSVDYLSVHDTKGFLLVEFSDLWKQNITIQEQALRIKQSNLPKSDKQALRRELFKAINKELCTKFKDSLTILQAMQVDVKNIPTEFYNERPKYIIVVAPINEQDTLEKKQEILRFLDILKDKVAQSIPAPLFNRVSIIPLQSFV